MRSKPIDRPKPLLLPIFQSINLHVRIRTPSRRFPAMFYERSCVIATVAFPVVPIPTCTANCASALRSSRCVSAARFTAYRTGLRIRRLHVMKLRRHIDRPNPPLCPREIQRRQCQMTIVFLVARAGNWLADHNE